MVENRTRLPRAFFVSHARLVRTEREARAHVTNAGFDPRRQVVLEVEQVRAPTRLRGRPQFRPARVTAYENERVEVEVDAPRAGWLVLLDRWAPGWSARRHGGLVRIHRANYLFRAVRVTAGVQRVVFEYRNTLFHWGGLLTALGLAVTVGAGVSLLRGRLAGRARP